MHVTFVGIESRGDIAISSKMEGLSSKMVRLVWCVLMCVCYSYGGEAKVTGGGDDSVTALIVFGDSIVDTGSNNNLVTTAKCNFLPYGRDFEGGKPTGRFSNGKVPSDLIAAKLGIKNLVPSYMNSSLQPNDLLTGVTFASGGSGYDPLTPKLMSVRSLSEQLRQFKEYIGKLKGYFGEEKTNFTLSKSIILLVLSSNDIANNYFSGGVRKAQYDFPSYADLLLQYASSFIQEIYGLGVRRMGVMGAPPLGCLPMERTKFGGILRKCSQEINEASQLFNAKLSAQLQSLNQNLTQARLVYIDVYNPLLHIIENPTEYGFEVVDKGCCATGTVEAAALCNPLDPICPDNSKYVFWDSYHPTERTYQIIVGSSEIYSHI